MGCQQKGLLTWVLCAVFVLWAIYGSKGPVSYFVMEFPKPSHILPFSRRIVLLITSRSPSNALEMKLHPSRMLAPSVLPAYGPARLGFGVSPSPAISSSLPHTKERASSPAYHRKSQSKSAPSPATLPRGFVAHPPFSMPPNFEAVSPTIQAIIPSMQPSAPSDHVSVEHKRPKAISPSIESQAPSLPVGAAHALPPSFTTPPLAQSRKGMPKGQVHGRAPNNSAPAALTHAPVSPPRKVVLRPPTMQPSIPRIAPSITRHAPSTINFKRPAVSPALTTSPVIHGKRHGMPVAAPSKQKSSHLAPVHHSHGKGPAVSPALTTSPVIHGRRHGMPVAAPSKQKSSHLAPVHHSHGKGYVPVISPEAMRPSNTTHAPSISHPPISHPQPPAGRILHIPAPAPAPAPTTLSHQRTAGKRVGSPAPASSYPFPPASYHSAPSHPPAVFPKNSQSTPPHFQGPSRAPVQAPFYSTDSGGAPVPSPSLMVPSDHNEWPIHSPMLSPSGSSSRRPRAPRPHPIQALPPPPPNLDCTPLACTEPLTNTPPGSPCACVRPMKVGLRLSVALYTFFPLVSELAQEIASGISLKQSQVRIMGADASSEEPEKTIVLLYLVPLGEKFDNTTAFLIYEKFWKKQVAIKAGFYGDYDVLYILYPGLPPSPPTAPANINADDGTIGNDNKSRTIHPLGVDVRKRKEKLSGSLLVIIVLSSVIALFLCIGAAWVLLLKCRDHTRVPASTPQTLLPSFAKPSAGTGPVASASRPSSASVSFSSSMATYTGAAKTFSLSEIERATSRFDDSRIIGEGGFGRVYQGTFEDGTMVAVKVLKRDDQQGGREFLSEVEMLSRLHHRNLVKLIGICTEEHARCLVYELIPNGSVESHLHGVDKETAPLDWGARMKIALGAARGLAYLHEDSSPRVIHRDFKSSNILLEYDFTPKVSDFGLARAALDEGNGHISTRVMGTFGYVAPEYAMTGHLLVKSDVYSYGVVLLELLTGRKPVDMLQPPGQENLVTWARPLLTSKDGLEIIIDPALGTNFPFDSVAKVAAIASMCVQPEVSHRPFMGEVVQALKLVCNESDEYRGSGSCSREELSAEGMETRISTGLDLEAERVLSTSDIFSTSARFTRDVSGSFRRHSSSGPLRTGRTGPFWQRIRGLSSGSMSEHGFSLRSSTRLEGGEQWP